MDRSFEGLLASLVLHAILVWALLHARPPMQLAETPTEITIVERSEKSFVTETHTKSELEELKEQANLLSALTKRVRQQMKARESGPTRNAAPHPIPQPARRKSENGFGPMNPPLRQVAIGASSLAEHIPGIQEGAFTSLNTDQFTFYAFFARTNEQVRNRWVREIRNYMSRLSQHDLENLARRERQTVVEIILTRTGEFYNSILHASSGDTRLDQAAVDAFRQASPFINPPQEMVENDGMIHLRYGFVVHFRPSFGPGG